MGGLYSGNFGLDPNTYDFGDGTDPNAEDPTDGSSVDSLTENALRALRTRRAVAGDLSTYGEKPPQPITIQRVQKETQDDSLLARHPEAGKWLDLVNQLGAVLANRKKEKWAKKNPRGNPNYVPIPAGQFNARGKAIQGETYKNEYQSAKDNAQIAESEARINDSAWNRYQGRQVAAMGQIVPSLSRAAFRPPPTPKVSALQQRLDMYDRFADENNIPPAERMSAKKHILGSGDTRTPEQKASQSAQAHVDFLKATDAYRTSNPKAGSTLDASERNRQVAARYVAELIYNDYENPDTATKKGVEMFRQLESGLGSNAKNTVGAVPPLPQPTPGLPPGVPASPSGGSYQAPGAPAAPLPGQVGVKGDMGGLPPDLSARINLYAQMVNRHPERRAQLRENLMRTYGVDPDLYLTTGP